MKNFLIAGATLFSLALTAQTVEFVEPRNVQSIDAPEYKTFQVKDHTYVLYKKFRMASPILYDLQLDAYDANMKPIGSNQIDKTLEPNDANIYEGIFALSDKLVMFKSEYTKADGSSIYYYPFSPSGSRQAGTELVSFPAEKAMNSGNFDVAVSDDGSKVAVWCQLPHVKDSLEHAILYVYDNTFKELWHADFRLPYESEKAPHNNIYVNNAGVVFDMKQVPVKKSFDFYTMFTFINATTRKETKIDLGQDGHISTYQTGFCTNGDLYVAGYSYTDKKAGVNVDEPSFVFAVKASAADGSLPVDKVTPIEKQANLKAQKLFVQADNTVIFIGEYVNESSSMRAAPAPPGTYDYTYSYGNITAMKFDASGNKTWSYLVEKDRTTNNDGGKFQSFGAFIMNGNLVIVYEDYLYRHDGKEHKVVGPILMGEFVDVVVTVNQEGSKLSESYINDPRMGGEKGEYFLIPRTGTKVNDNTMFFIGMRGLELVGIKVNLK